MELTVPDNNGPSGFAPGSLVLGRLVLEEEIGMGGMGQVWRAHHLTLDMPVAVKVCLSRHPTSTSRFQQEARIGATLRSPNICRVLDAGEEAGFPVLVMEFLQGQTLAERLVAEGRLLESELLEVVGDLATGLECAHRAGILHRDIKPSNVFLEQGGPAKLLDFGIAYDTNGREHTASGEFVGTPRYASPEQCHRPRSADATSDLWSLAIVVYACLAGRKALEALQPQQQIDEMALSRVENGSRWVGWFARATHPETSARFCSVQEFVSELARVVNPLQTSAAPAPASATTSPSSRALRGVDALVLGAVLLGLVAISQPLGRVVTTAPSSPSPQEAATLTLPTVPSEGNVSFGPEATSIVGAVLDDEPDRQSAMPRSNLTSETAPASTVVDFEVRTRLRSRLRRARPVSSGEREAANADGSPIVKEGVDPFSYR